MIKGESVLLEVPMSFGSGSLATFRISRVPESNIYQLLKSKTTFFGLRMAPFISHKEESVTEFR